MVLPANIQDRDGGVLLVKDLFGRFPFLQRLFADSGYQGAGFREGIAEVAKSLKTEIVKRTDKEPGFKIQPKRWIIERTIGWCGRCRRLAKDFENLNRKAVAFLKLASVRLMLRRLCSTK